MGSVSGFLENGADVNITAQNEEGQISFVPYHRIFLCSS